MFPTTATEHHTFSVMLALYASTISSFSAGLSGQVVLGVMKWVVVRQMGHVRSACTGAATLNQEQQCNLSR
jgi:hypothetical protein